MTSSQVENDAFYQRAGDETQSVCAASAGSLLTCNVCRAEMNEPGGRSPPAGVSSPERGVNGSLEGRMTLRSVSFPFL